MNGILSQGEIEALLQLAQTIDSAPASPSVESRDFRRPLVCSGEQLVALRKSMSESAKELAKAWSDLLRMSVTAELTLLEQSRFESLLTSLSDPCCVYRVKMDPGPAPATLVLDTPLALAAVERLFGGSGKSKLAPRGIRPAEKPIVDRVANKAIAALVQGLASTAKFTPSLGALVSEKKDASFVEPGAAVLLAGFGIGGDLPAGEIRFAIPFANFPGLAKPQGAKKAAPAKAGAVPPSIFQAILPAKVGLEGGIGRGRLLVGEFLLLEPGDVISLATKVGESAKISIAGSPAFLGSLGHNEGHWAIEVESVIPDGLIGGKP